MTYTPELNCDGHPDAMARFTDAQIIAIARLCGRFGVEMDTGKWHHPFDLPEGYVAGHVGVLYVGVAPDGRICS